MIGQKLGRYRIETQLGKGGMGTVWLGVDERLGRKAAIKVLAENSAGDERRRKRFLREAQLASRLNHPNIVSIYEVGSESGIEYLAMEYVCGESLVEIIKRGPMPPQAVRDLIRQAADGLAVAHEAGIWHRDLKPSNIMVSESGLLKVLDFGLAQGVEIALEQAAGMDATRTQLTDVGAVLGTYGYMSPEQLMGDSTDARTDIFSLGVVWFELLSGQSPFRGSTRTEQSRRMMSEGARDLRSLRPGVGERERSIVMKCLANNRDERYENARTLVREIDSQPSKKTGNQWLRATQVAVVLLVVAGFGYWDHERKQSLGAPENQPQTLASRLDRARAALNRYEKPGNIEVAQREAEAMLAGKENPAVAYQVLAQAGLAQHTLVKDPLIVRQALGWARKSVELQPELGLAQSTLGVALTQSGKLDEAKAHLEMGVQLDPKNGYCWLGLALWKAAKQDWSGASEAFQAGGQKDPASWMVRAGAGAFYYRRGEMGAALQAFEEARNLVPDHVRVLSGLSSVFHMLDRNEEAASVLQRAVELQPSATLYSNLGTLLFFDGRYAEALGPMRKAVELGGNEFRNWGNLGDTLRWIPARKGEANEAYATAIRLAEERLQKTPANVEWQTALLLYRVKRGEKKNTEQELRRLAGIEKLPGGVLYELAVSAELTGNRSLAMQLLLKSIKAGYAIREVKSDPELVSLRTDEGYLRMETQQSSRQ